MKVSPGGPDTYREMAEDATGTLTSPLEEFRAAHLDGLVSDSGRRRGERVVRARRRRARAMFATDLGALGLAAAASTPSAERVGASVGPSAWVAVYLALVFVTLAWRGGYRFRLESSSLDHLGVAFVATAMAATLTMTVRQLVDPDPAAAAQTVSLWAFATVFLFAGRLTLNVATRHRRGLPTIVIGAGVVGQMVARRLQERPGMGLEPVGFLDKDPLPVDDNGSTYVPPPVLGASWDLERVVREHHIEHAIISFSTAPDTVLVNLVRSCRELGVDVSVVPRLFEEVHSQLQVEHIGGVALLRVGHIDPRGWQFDLKYALDRVVAGAILALISPLYALLALAVRVSSPGPILFRQWRVGLDGRQFEILKFRTMRMAEGAEQHNAAWAASAIGDPTHALPDQPDRRTAIGRVLRRLSIDELPQLLNVIRGEMSIIGPRPEMPHYVEAFELHVYRYGDRHRVRSGITGWSQVQGLRGDTSLRDRIEWDNFYVENWSPWLDLKIMLLTFPAVLTGHGAE